MEEQPGDDGDEPADQPADDESGGADVDGDDGDELDLATIKQENADLKLLLSAYMDDDLDLDTELGRITRAGNYEKPASASKQKSGLASRRKKPKTDEAPPWEERRNQIRQQKINAGLAH